MTFLMFCKQLFQKRNIERPTTTTSLVGVQSDGKVVQTHHVCCYEQGYYAKLFKKALKR